MLRHKVFGFPSGYQYCMFKTSGKEKKKKQKSDRLRGERAFVEFSSHTNTGMFLLTHMLTHAFLEEKREGGRWLIYLCHINQSI